MARPRFRIPFSDKTHEHDLQNYKFRVFVNNV